MIPIYTYYIYTRLHQPITRRRQNTTQEIMSTPQSTPCQQQISCNPRKTLRNISKRLPILLQNILNLYQPPQANPTRSTLLHLPTPPHALQILPQSFFFCQLQTESLFLCYLSLSLSLSPSLSIIVNFFGSPAWQQIFAQSDRLSFFLRDRFSRQFSKLLSHTHSLSLCLSFFLSLSFSVCPYASSVSCKCCPSANKIYFFVCSACLICFSLSSRPATPHSPTYSKANNHHRLPEWRSRRRRRRRRQSAKNQPTPTTFDTRMAIKCFEAIFLVYIVFFLCVFGFFFSLFHFAACCR